MSASLTVRVRVNGREHTAQVPARLLLSDFLRGTLGLTGTHVGCEHGVCGACTVHLDGAPVRACLLLAVQADGAEITTVEGLAPAADRLHPVQEAFRQEHGLQCGFCTPGILMTVTAFLREHPRPTDDEIRAGALRQPLPLHRLPEHRAGGSPRERASDGRSAMTTRLIGARVPRTEDPRLLRGLGCFVDDVDPAGRAPRRRACAARTRTHASARSTPRALARCPACTSWSTAADLGELNQPGAAADPASRAHAAAHAAAAGVGRGALRRRDRRLRRGRRPVPRRGRGRR